MQTADSETSVKSRVGRKPLNKPAVTKKLLAFIESGLSIKQACAAAGCGVSTLREWRAVDPTLEERLEAAREVMRAKILAQIKEAGAKDWRALECYLRLSFAEYRFGTGNTVNIDVTQQSMTITDPQRAELIRMREAVLANKRGSSAPLQLTDKSGDVSDAREIALESERSLKEAPKQLAPPAEPKRKPMTIVERADTIQARMIAEGWRPSDTFADELDD